MIGFYFALLCLNDCLDSAITCFNFLNLLCFGLMDHLQLGVAFAFRAVSTEGL